MTTIAVARLRSRVNYTKPLDHILDSFYHCLQIFKKNHPEINFTYYNFSFGQKPDRNIDAIKNANIILIPTENEFHAWVPNYLHRLDLAKCNQKIDLIKPYINNKKVILLRSDRADTPELYKNSTFSGCDFDIDVIDEDDFPQGIHVLKYYFLTEAAKSKTLSYDVAESLMNTDFYDFCYWGTDKRKLPGGQKSGDVRNDILKFIRKQNDISSMYIGRFYNIERNSGMLKMCELFPILLRTKSTLCFNWLSNTAVTSRYHEAMASTITTPLVWKNYDESNRLGIEEWQRCHTAEEVVEKIKWCSKNPEAQSKLYKKYVEKLPTIKETYELFEKLLLAKI